MQVMIKFQLCKRVFLNLLVIVFSMMILPVQAHTLEETSAQVILRDGQVEVRVLTDMDHLILTLQNDQAWLMGDIDAVMPDGLTHDQQEVFIKNALKATFSLFVNRQSLPFERVAVANHGHDTEIVFQARHAFAKVTDITISFPKSLGSVHASFVKPQYRILSADDTATIIF
ncbi:hypothetical protein O1D97_00225 [Marinomonas sp. 15G1-11]|uniref:Uncharacterized protein n=1 Tax=Marinomonas phaeophyticola TaxID=3004091 RepID=A0ABT4JR75_9GAMM|nr:hypothetical protein [Marinomonas sp. 15G1-11]MCZ2720104.1 hypothetical protein [Marinomonas sp. 15G1-11]